MSQISLHHYSVRPWSVLYVAQGKVGAPSSGRAIYWLIREPVALISATRCRCLMFGNRWDRWRVVNKNYGFNKALQQLDNNVREFLVTFSAVEKYESTLELFKANDYFDSGFQKQYAALLKSNSCFCEDKSISSPSHRCCATKL